MNRIPTGRVAWYAVGRFYKSSDGTLQDLGYFPYLAGLPEPLFATGEPDEETAFFTFRAVPFRPEPLPSVTVDIALDPPGEFHLFYNPEPKASFADPDSFSCGQRIATFRRPHVTLGATVGPVTTNVLTAELVSSAPFTFRGTRYDLGEALPWGITQFGTASATPLPGIPGFPQVFAFAGSAVAAGAP